MTEQATSPEDIKALRESHAELLAAVVDEQASLCKYECSNVSPEHWEECTEMTALITRARAIRERIDGS